MLQRAFRETDYNSREWLITAEGNAYDKRCQRRICKTRDLIAQDCKADTTRKTFRDTNIRRTDIKQGWPCPATFQCTGEWQLLVSKERNESLFLKEVKIGMQNGRVTILLYTLFFFPPFFFFYQNSVNKGGCCCEKGKFSFQRSIRTNLIIKNNLVLSTWLIMWIGPVEIRKLTFRALALRQIKLNYLVILPLTQDYSFFRNLPPFNYQKVPSSHGITRFYFVTTLGANH